MAKNWQLSMPNEMAEKVGDLYFKMNRNGMGKMVVLYDPNAAAFENRAMIEEGWRQDQRVAEAVQALMNGEEVDESV